MKPFPGATAGEWQGPCLTAEVEAELSLTHVWVPSASFDSKNLVQLKS